jgi:predicted RNA binding protein YcfA (HicA-like mRNA interferase family)
MKPVTGKHMCRVLERHGWVLDRVRGSHHIYRKSGHTPISVPVHVNKNLKPGTQRAIMRAAGLTDDDL